MALNLWRQLKSRKSKHALRANSKRLPDKLRSQLYLEGLEHRVIPATHIWQGLGATGDWSLAANWDIGVPNTSDDIIKFNQLTPKMTSNNNFSNKTFKSIQMEIGGYTLTGLKLNLTDGVSSTSGVNLIRMDLDLPNANTPITVAAGTIQIGQPGQTGGSISGAGGFRKEGVGKLILGRPNTYAHNTSVNAGILNIQNGTALGSTAGFTRVEFGTTLELQGNIAVGAESLRMGDAGVGGTLRNVADNNSWAGFIGLQGAVPIDVVAGKLTHTGSFGNQNNITGGFVKSGGGTLTLGNGSGPTNNHSGDSVVNAGTLELNKGPGSLAMSGNLIIGDGIGGSNSDVSACWATVPFTRAFQRP